MKRILPVPVVLVLVLGAWSCDDAPGGPALAPETELGFVMMLTGKVAVVDLQSLSRIGVIGGGTTITHGAAIMPGQRTAWVGNRFAGSLDRIELSADASSSAVVRSIPIPHEINRVVLGWGAARIGVMGDDPGHPYGAHVSVVDPEAGALLGTVDIPLEVVGPTSQPVEGEGAPLQECTTCPRTGVVFLADGRTAVASHVRNHALYRISLEDFSVGQTVHLPAPSGEEPGPSPFLALSPDGAALAVPGLRASTVYVYDTSDLSAAPRAVDTDLLPIEVEWSPDGRSIWVLTAESEPVIGDETRNAAIPTRLLVLDASTFEVVDTITWRAALNHVALTPDGRWALVTSARGILLQYDTHTRDLHGTVQLSASIIPLLDVVF